MHHAEASGASRAAHRLLVVGVQELELARLDAGEVPPPRIHQELLAVGRHRQAEVVGDRLVPAELRRQPERRRQVDAQLPLHRFGPPARIDAGHPRHAASRCPSGSAGPLPGVEYSLTPSPAAIGPAGHRRTCRR